MTTYYVSTAGNDANDGLGADASQSSKPWLTIAKALGAAGIASGDTVYLGPGTYRETVTINMTSATVTTTVAGDPCNLQGFKDGSGVLLAPALVRWTAYTTNDTTAPSASNTLLTNAKDFLTFSNILFVGPTNAASLVGAGGTTSTDITFTNCVFIHPVNQICISVGAAATTALNWTISNCAFMVGGGGTSINLSIATTSSGADWDLNFRISNCLFLAGGGGFGVTLAPTGGLTKLPGGVVCFNSTFLGGSVGFRTTAASSTSIPCTIYNSIVANQNTANLSAQASNQITEDFNYLCGPTNRTNVGTGGSSVAGNPPAYSFLIHLMQQWFASRVVPPLFSPITGSPLLAFGAQAGGPSTDIMGMARPATYGLGCFEDEINFLSAMKRAGMSGRA